MQRLRRFTARVVRFTKVHVERIVHPGRRARREAADEYIFTATTEHPADAPSFPYLDENIIRQNFLEEAGGMHISRTDYRSLDVYWAFFRTSDGQDAPVLYSAASKSSRALPASVLRDGDGNTGPSPSPQGIHSLEHIVPKSVLSKFLADREPGVVRGARTNPFNLFPEHRDVNARRGVRNFDFDGDVPVPGAAQNDKLWEGWAGYRWRETGVDKDGEWIVPTRARGIVARAVLYMVAMYELRCHTKEQIDTMISWTLAIPPEEWEASLVEFYAATSRFRGLRNPLVAAHTSYTRETLEALCFSFALDDVD